MVERLNVGKYKVTRAKDSRLILDEYIENGYDTKESIERTYDHLIAEPVIRTFENTLKKHDDLLILESYYIKNVINKLYDYYSNKNIDNKALIIDFSGEYTDSSGKIRRSLFTIPFKIEVVDTAFMSKNIYVTNNISIYAHDLVSAIDKAFGKDISIVEVINDTCKIENIFSSRKELIDNLLNIYQAGKIDTVEESLEGLNLGDELITF